MFLLNLLGWSESAVGISRSTKAELFGRLYQEYLPRVYQYANYRVGNRDEVEELVSIIFEKALTKFSSFDPKKASFSTWIFTIARNTITDYYRRKSRQQKYDREIELQASEPSTSLEEEVLHSEEIHKLHQCLSHLKHHERELISLKFSGDMTNREIAKITGYSESNVGTILCRALHKLREEFARWGYDKKE